MSDTNPANIDGGPHDEELRPRRRRRWPWVILVVVGFFVAWHLLSRVTTVVPAPAATVAAVTDRIYEEVYSEDIIRRARELPPEVNILLVGLDNRVASTDNHADAIHLISVRTRDSIGVTITSIPRGTEVRGYGIAPEFSFMANVRAVKGRKALMKAVSNLTKRRKINYYVEVTFSQVMGVLELLGYKDPATALQYLRHRKSFLLGDVQRSYNQGKFIRSQIVRRADLLTGAKGDILIRMGLGMVDTDLDLETVQALVYLLRDANALNEEFVSLEMRPKINYARLDQSESPDPDEIATIVNQLVRRTGKDIDDLGRYNPYPKLKAVVDRASAHDGNAKAVVSILQPVFSQKAWLQIQERPQRREIRDRTEDLLVKAYTALKKPEKAAEVHDYMVSERKAFSEVERETRRFSYGRRAGVRKSGATDLRRERLDNLGQQQTHVEPQQPTVAPESPPVPPDNDLSVPPASDPQHAAPPVQQVSAREQSKPSTKPERQPDTKKESAPDTKEIQVFDLNEERPK